MGYEREPGEEPANAGGIIGRLRGQQITEEKPKICADSENQARINQCFHERALCLFPNSHALRMPGFASSVEKYSWTNFRYNCALKLLQLGTHRHLTTLDERANQCRIHRPVQSTERIGVVTHGAALRFESGR